MTLADALEVSSGPGAAPRTVLVYRQRLLARSETFIAAQVRALRRWNAVLMGEEAAGELEGEGLPVTWLWSGRPSLFERLLRRTLGRWRLAYAPGLSGLKNVGLVHAHFGCDGVDAQVIARRLRVPLLVTLHGFDIMTHESVWRRHPEKWARAYPDRLRRLADSPSVHFIAVSKTVRDRALEWGLPRQRIAVLPIGIDTRFFRPGPTPLSERPVRILFVGRLVEKKGVGVLLRAVARLEHEAELVIGGEGPLRQVLGELAQTLGIAHRVQFRGALTAQAVRDELDSARLLCLPSVQAQNGDAEGFGQVLLEAQAAGLPVVTSAQAAWGVGFVEGVTGHYFGEHDDRALAAHLDRLLGDARLLEQMGAMARSWVSNRFDISTRTARLETHYDRLVARAHQTQEVY